MKVDIDSIKRKMLVKYPLFGSVVANLDYVESRSCCDYNGNPTAGTDGNTVYYHPDFMSNLSEDEQTFIMAHEVCHVALDHIFRSEGKDKELWNTATDAVINAYLKQDGLNMVKGGVDIPDAINYDAEEMYERLLKEKEQSKNSNQGNNSSNNDSTNNDNQNTQSSQSSSSSNSSPSDNQNNDVGHDTHSLWDDAIKKKKQQEQQSSEQESKGTSSQSEESKEQDKKKQSFLDRIFNRKKEENKDEVPSKVETPKENSDNDIEEQIKEMSKEGEKKIFKQNKVERKKQLEELKQSLASQSLGAGNSTNSIFRNIDNIGVSKPLVDWRIVLREAVNIEVDWSYGNATVEDGVVTPRLEDLPKPETEIVLDTSGSIDSNLLKNFLRECKNILQTSKVKVGCFDTRFYGFNEIRNESDIDNMQFQGGGGTNFNVAVSAFSKRVENKIIFTDGEADMPKEAIDAIWIVFGNNKINPKNGKVIYINDNELRRLCSYQSVDNKGRSR